MANVTTCHNCEGQVLPVDQGGRQRSYRGTMCVLPRGFLVATCQQCGAEWMDSADLQRLTAILEPQRLAATRDFLTIQNQSSSSGMRNAGGGSLRLRLPGLARAAAAELAANALVSRSAATLVLP